MFKTVEDFKVSGAKRIVVGVTRRAGVRVWVMGAWDSCFCRRGGVDNCSR